MYRYKLNKFEDAFLFLWDNEDSTIQEIDEYLKEVKGDNWSVGRCWNDVTKRNDSDTLCIKKEEGSFSSSSFYKNGEYLLDKHEYFIGCDEKYLVDNNIIYEEI